MTRMRQAAVRGDSPGGLATVQFSLAPVQFSRAVTGYSGHGANDELYANRATASVRV